MPINFDTSAATVGELFSQPRIFRMPEFQRPYSWTEELALQLYEDLQAAYIDSGDKYVGEYYLGALIVKQEGQAAYYVVDGQQRLVTLTSILAVIRDHLPHGPFRTSLQTSIVRQADHARRYEAGARVQLREIDQDAFFRWVVTDGGTTRLPSIADTTSTARLLNVLRRINDEYEDVKGAFNEGFATFILNQCSVVLVSTDTLEMAYKLFKSVNNVGMKLDAMAMARAELLGPTVSDRALCNNIANSWDEIEGQIGEENLQAYVMTVASLVLSDNNVQDPFEAIRIISRNATFASDFNMKLWSFLQAYLTLDSAEVDFGSDSLMINRHISCIKHSAIDEWRPAALHWLIQSKSAPESEAFFRALDGLCLGLTLLGGTSTTKRAKRFDAVIAAISSGTALNRTTSPLYLTPEEKRRIRSKITGHMKASDKTVRHLLSRLNVELMPLELPAFFVETAQVEHVLPQRPPQNGSWEAAFPDPEERESLTYMLGNLTLLTSRANKRAGNASFSEKKQRILGLSENNCFALTSNISTYAEWTPDVIRDRHDKLVRHAANIMAL